MSEGQQDRPHSTALNRYDLTGQLEHLRRKLPLSQYGRVSLTLVCDQNFTLLLVALKA